MPATPSPHSSWWDERARETEAEAKRKKQKREEEAGKFETQSAKGKRIFDKGRPREAENPKMVVDVGKREVRHDYPNKSTANEPEEDGRKKIFDRGRPSDSINQRPIVSSKGTRWEKGPSKKPTTIRFGR